MSARGLVRCNVCIAREILAPPIGARLQIGGNHKLVAYHRHSDALAALEALEPVRS